MLGPGLNYPVAKMYNVNLLSMSYYKLYGLHEVLNYVIIMVLIQPIQ